MVFTKPQLIIFLVGLLIIPLFSGGHNIPYIIAAILISLLAAFLTSRLSERPALGWKGPVLPMLALITWSALSLAWSVNRYQTINWVIVLGLVVSTFILTYQFSNKPELIKFWIRLYLVVAVLFSLFGFGLYLTQSYDRFTSTIYWANPAAGYLLPAIIIAWWQWAEFKQRWSAVSGIIVSTAFLLTFSRGAGLILALGGVGVVAVLRRPLNFWLRLLAGVGASAALFILLNFARTQFFHQHVLDQGSRFSEAARGESVSFQDRLNYLRSAVDIWQDHPLLGTGAATYATVHPQYQTRVISASSSAHNIYVQMVSELGLVGGILLLWLLFEIARSLRLAWKAEPTRRPLIIGLILLLLHLGIEIDNSYPVILILTASLTGLAYLQPSSRPSKAKIYPWALPIALLLLAIPSYSSYASTLKVQQGDLALDDHDYEQAANLYLSAHSTLTYDPDVLTKQGIARFTLNAIRIQPAENIASAQKLARQAIKQDPEDSQHYFLLARVQRENSAWDQAEQAYLTALAKDPYNHPDYYSDLATLYMQLNQLNKAAQTLDKAITLYPDSVVGNRFFIPTTIVDVSNLYLARAILDQKLQNNAAAQVAVSKALKINPDSSGAKIVQSELKAQLSE